MDNETLVADLVEFVSRKPRAYEEVMAAWRTSCPRLAIWEDAVDNGLLSRKGRMVVVTDEGMRFVERLRPGRRPPGESTRPHHLPAHGQSGQIEPRDVK